MYIPVSPLTRRALFYVRQLMSNTSTSTREGFVQAATAIRTLITTIGWPLFTPRPWNPGDLPIQEEYQDMLAEVQLDLNTVTTALPALAQQGVDLSNFGQSQYLALGELLQSAQSDLVQLKQSVSQQLIGHVVSTTALSQQSRRNGETLIETWQTDTHINHGQSTGILFLPTAECVTLQRDADLDLSSLSTVTVQILDPNTEEVLGLPGNSLEIAQTAINPIPTQQTPQVTYVGASEKHASVAALLDSDPSSWFEFERCDAEDRQPLYQIGTSWVSGVANKKEVPVPSKVKPRRRILHTTTPTSATQSLHECFAPDTWEMDVLLSDGKTQRELICPWLGSPPDDILQLNTTFLFPSAHFINFLDVTPYVSPAASECLPRVEQIQLLTEQGPVTVFEGRGLNARQLGSVTTWTVPTPVACQGVRFNFVQPQAYSAYLGHHYLVATVKEKKTTTMLWFFHSTSNKTLYTRIMTPRQALNLAYQKKSNIFSALGALGGGVFAGLTLHGTLVAVGSGILGTGITSLLTTLGAPLGLIGVIAGVAAGWLLGSGLWSSKTTRTVESVLEGDDIIQGKRWAIGLRDIGMRQLRYSEAGTLVTTPYSFQQPVNGVVLQVTQQSVPDCSWLTAWASPDNTTWYPVVDNQSLVEFPTPTTQVFLKFQLQRRNQRDDDAIFSPVLSGYTLQGFYAL